MITKRVTKEMLYQSIVDTGIVLPKMSSTICNMNYMVRVRKNQEYCPRKSEIEFEQNVCANPPKKLILLDIILDELQKKGDNRAVTFDEKHLPDVDWCLYSVFALNPLHIIFEPQYIPVKGQKGRRGNRYIPQIEDLEFSFTTHKFGKEFTSNTANDLPIQEKSKFFNLNLREKSQKNQFNTFQNQFEENKVGRQEKVLIRKVLTDQKHKQKFGSMSNHFDLEKVGSFFEMMQEVMQPYFDSQNGIEIQTISTKEKKKKKANYTDKQNSQNLQRAFENKRAFSVHTSASSDNKITGFQSQRNPNKSPQSRVESTSQEKETFTKPQNNIDQVMKDEIITIENSVLTEQEFKANRSEHDEQQSNVENNNVQLFNI